MPGSWKKRCCLFASVDLRGPLPIELRDQAATPGDGIVAEPVPHRIYRLVDLATECAGTADRVQNRINRRILPIFCGIKIRKWPISAVSLWASPCD